MNENRSCPRKDGFQKVHPHLCAEAKSLHWTDIKIGKMIGMGGQASVYQVTHAPTSQIYALKVIRAERYMTKDVVWRVCVRVCCILYVPLILLG